MQITTHASECEVAIANLTQELMLKADEAERCQEMIDRLATYNKDDKLPKEIVDFVAHYTRCDELISTEESTFLETAGNVLKTVLSALWTAIKWIFEKIVAIFRYLFDRNYRATKAATDLQRRVLTLQTNQALVNKFESIQCNVVVKEDVDNIIQKSMNLVVLIQNAAKMNRIDYIQTLIDQFADVGSVSIDTTTCVLTDVLPQPVPQMSTTYGMANWTFDGYLSTISRYIELCRCIEKLRETEKETKSQAASLKKRADDAALGKLEVSDINALQQEAAAKVNMVKIISYAIAINVRRSDNVLSFLNAMYNEMHAQTK